MKLNEAIEIPLIEASNSHISSQKARELKSRAKRLGINAFANLVAVLYVNAEMERMTSLGDELTQSDLPKLEKLKKKRVSDRQIKKFIEKNKDALKISEYSAIDYNQIRAERNEIYFDYIDELKTQPFRKSK